MKCSEMARPGWSQPTATDAFIKGPAPTRREAYGVAAIPARVQSKLRRVIDRSLPHFESGRREFHRRSIVVSTVRDEATSLAFRDVSVGKFGGASRDRTGDLVNAIQTG